ncbi:MAG: hypothetical protein IJW43_04095 [Clostridia bacterium]|nr:hypothetical protein [Clostridia bacterium]
MKNIIVSDVTLRALSQTEQKLTFREKLSIAESLDLVKVDALELPFVSDSKEEEVICRTISSSVKDAIVKISVGDSEESVEKAFKCIKGATKPCLQVIMPTSTTLMEYFYHLKSSAMLDKIALLTKTAKSYCENVEFVAVDAFRAEDGFVKSCAKVAVENGASAITLADTEGTALREQYENLIKEVKESVDALVFVEPSNKLSLGVSLSIDSIKAGADGIKTSSIGDYVSVSQLANLFREKRFDLGAQVQLDITKTNTVFAEVGKNIEVENQENTKVSGVVEGIASLKDIVEITKKLGYDLSDEDYGKVYEEFKRVTAKKEAIDIKEFEAIVASNAMQVSSTYHLVSFVVNSSNIISATANVVLEKDGEKLTGVSTGDGPIDAAFHAIEQIIGHHYELDDFQVQAVTKGRGAVGSSIIRLRANGKLYPGNGVSTDIIGACIRAYINAINKIVYEEK